MKTIIEDSRIREALHHWTPRFLFNGVDYRDLQRIINDMDSWDDWCRVWSAMGAEHEALAEATHCPTELLVYPEGNHAGNNIVYKVHADLTDWLAEKLGHG